LAAHFVFTAPAIGRAGERWVGSVRALCGRLLRCLAAGHIAVQIHPRLFVRIERPNLHALPKREHDEGEQENSRAKFERRNSAHLVISRRPVPPLWRNLAPFTSRPPMRLARRARLAALCYLLTSIASTRTARYIAHKIATKHPALRMVVVAEPPYEDPQATTAVIVTFFGYNTLAI
jgi:hypothetical protein